MKPGIQLVITMAGAAIIVVIGGLASGLRGPGAPAPGNSTAPPPAPSEDAPRVRRALEARLGKPLLDALVGDDRDAATQLFLPEATCEAPTDRFSQRQIAGGVLERHAPVSPRQTMSVSPAGLVAYLSERLAEFQHVDGRQFRVISVERAEGRPGAWSLQALISVLGENDAGDLLELEVRSRLLCRYGQETVSGQVIAAWRIESVSLRTSPRRLTPESGASPSEVTRRGSARRPPATPVR